MVVAAEVVEKTMCVGDDGGGASNISEGMLLVSVVLFVVVMVKG